MTELECVRKKKGDRERVTREERRWGEGSRETDDGVASPLGWQMKCCTWRRDLFHRKLQTGRGC